MVEENLNQLAKEQLALNLAADEDEDLEDEHDEVS